MVGTGNRHSTDSCFCLAEAGNMKTLFIVFSLVFATGAILVLLYACGW
jgi:hypothetical protein